MPAPSPTTNPSRSASNGRLARSGSSLRVESAFIAANPPTPMGVMAASDAAADHHFRVAALDDVGSESPTACAEAEHAVAVAEFGPLRAVANGDVAGSQVDDRRGNEKRGDACRDRPADSLECSRSITSNPPMPDPT